MCVLEIHPMLNVCQCSGLIPPLTKPRVPKIFVEPALTLDVVFLADELVHDWISLELAVTMTSAS